MHPTMYCGPGFLDGAGSLDRPSKELSGKDGMGSLSVSCRHH